MHLLQRDKELDLSARTLRTAVPTVGYQGHVPKALDSFGTSHWRAEAPDPHRHQEMLYSA